MCCVTRVGIFRASARGDRTVCAQLCAACQKRRSWNSQSGPVVRWFELHAPLIRRANLRSGRINGARATSPALDTFGAEVKSCRLCARAHIGWIFSDIASRANRRLQRLEGSDPGREHFTVLENALLYEEMTVQKTPLRHFLRRDTARHCCDRDKTALYVGSTRLLSRSGVPSRCLNRRWKLTAASRGCDTRCARMLRQIAAAAVARSDHAAFALAWKLADCQIIALACARLPLSGLTWIAQPAPENRSCSNAQRWTDSRGQVCRMRSATRSSHQDFCELRARAF